ncbi:MAG: MoxR family ATPase [Bacillota bacterium]|nr:MoxR family ATPase [Bacillota bacterium]HOB42265.1 MoxR family ATPase [Bacillota bacterium]HPZ13479.1 MoxR family ATPase [Bacillota bacterium]HQD79964.1 MoxR family ATPase [Bacillota bacterium]
MIIQASAKCHEIISSVSAVIVGKDDELQFVLMSMIADGHLLLEDVPGVAKTLTAQCFAQALGLNFKRIQFVPDLLPGDITGSAIYDARREDFKFKPGPIFANLILADEVNRGTPKTQSALLEAMQERQVTVEGQSYVLDPPFLVIATQNPLEFEGTYPLPEAQIDRFIARLRLGYPSPEAEREILSRRQDRRTDRAVAHQAIEKSEFLQIQNAVEHVYVSAEIQDYIVSITTETRNDRRVQLGASPRGSLALFKLARARALMYERDYVVPDDVKAVAVPALAHRILLRPELWAERITGESIVEDALDRVPVPVADWARAVD